MKALGVLILADDATIGMLPATRLQGIGQTVSPSAATQAGATDVEIP